jgi:Lipase (class 3)
MNLRCGLILLLLPYFGCSYVAERNSGGDGSIHCNELWTGGTHDDDEQGPQTKAPGKLCVQLRHHQVGGQPHLEVSYRLGDGEDVVLDSSFLWTGGDLSAMPLSTQDWPYRYDSTDHPSMGARYSVDLPLSRGNGITCRVRDENDHTSTVYIAAHPVIIRRANSNTTISDAIEAKMSRLESKSYLRSSVGSNPIQRANSTGFWWMELELQIKWCNSTEEIPQIVSSVQKRKRRRLQNHRNLGFSSCERHGAPMNVSRHSGVLTEEFLHRFHVVSTLSATVAYDVRLMSKVDYYRTLYDRFDGFDDGLNDAAVVVKTNDVCYGVFRGTVEYNLADEMQNLMPGFRKVDDTDCYVRSGFYAAYFTNYVSEFEESVRHCVNSCADGKPCELVLSGGSQGAAAAVVASIRLFQEFDPIVMSLGVMRTFLPTSPFDDHAQCTHVNKERHYHLVLTDSFLKAVDPVPYFFGFWTKTVGHEILYDGDGNFNYQGLAPNFTEWRGNSNFAIHTRWNYVVKSQKAYENACFPYPDHGWFDGHWCSDDAMCMTTSYCHLDDTCQPKLKDGIECSKDAACLSGSCVDGGTCTSSPAESLHTPIGQSCWVDKQCSSGRCEGIVGFSTCQMQLETGSACDEHGDCISGHCAGIFNGKCL